ncbi:MAG: YgiQ family radical SAM protein [Planctomycetota bacterium]|nr:MAG: YgiQ family radical SAM protein [Planctomycetota bacterium]
MIAQPDPAPFLPRTRSEMTARGWDQLDILLVTGDGYIDHPSFGVAVIGRVLEAEGYRVGVLDVPELEEDGSGWTRLPAPRLFVGVTAGTIDSMVTNYTAAKRKRRLDVYRPGGVPGRPNRATIGYTAASRHHFPGVPVVVGGLEAGPRRLAYWDYWDDKTRRSILVDAKADLLVWGMGERQVLEIARRLSSGETLAGIRGTCELVRKEALPEGVRIVPSFERLVEVPELHIDLFNAVREENSPSSRPLAQEHAGRWLLQHPPGPPASQKEIDHWFDLPYRRESHPDHDAAGGIAALEPVRWSINTHRGCMADCSFCSITFHQGRGIQSRSEESILREAAALAEHHDFRGTITDVGGPTANMYGLGCKLLEAGEACLGRDCLTPEPCPALRLDKTTEGYRRLLALVKGTKGVKHTFVSSGIRYDMLRKKNGELLPLHHDLVKNHVPGRMKLAPEHASERVLKAMNKPTFEVYEEYEADYKSECKELGRDQHLINYFIVGHPGTTIEDAVLLFEKLFARNYSPEQVQEFLPLPMTRANVQYLLGRDPLTGDELYVPRTMHERKVQKALVRWKAPESRPHVIEGLTAAGREDLLKRYLRHPAVRAGQRGVKGSKRGARKGAKSGARAAGMDLDTCG